MASEVIQSHATFAKDSNETGIMFKCGLFVSVEDHVAGVKTDEGKTWTVPLRNVLEALKAAGYKVTLPSSST